MGVNGTSVGSVYFDMLLNSNPFNKGLKSASDSIKHSGIEGSLKKIGKLAVAAFSVGAVVNFGKTCVQVATETSNAWIGLNSVLSGLTGQKEAFEGARKFINQYVSDGLVPLNNAVAAYKNLTLRGYNSEQIEKTMIALKNSATFARQSTYTLGEAVQTATEGLKNENSVVVDNAGVTKNVAKMWEDYAKSIGKTTNNLTQAEKIQAEVNGILEETKFQSNDASIYANTFSGKISQLNSAFTNMKVAIGNVIQPIAKFFIPIITNAVNVVTKLFTALSGVFSLFGLKPDSVETVSEGISNIASGASDASDSINNIGKSAKKTSKDLKNLASFDTAQILRSNRDSGSDSGSGADTAGVSGINDSLRVSTDLVEDSSGAFNIFTDSVRKFVDTFKNGFDSGIGDSTFEKLKDHIQNIKMNLIDIWTDPSVLNSANKWVNKILFVLGQTVGATARIGMNLAEGMLGSIDKYLSQNEDRIKTHIYKMFDISNEDIGLMGNLWQVIGEISDIFSGDTAKQIGADLIAMFTNPLMSIQEFFWKFTKDIKGIFFQPIIDNAEKIKTTFNEILEPIQIVTTVLSEAMTYVGDKWNEVYDNHIHPLMESLKTGLSDTFSKFLDVYNQYVVPAIKRTADKIKELWEQHLRPFVDKVAILCGSIFDLIKALWDNILKPVIDWIVKNVLPTLVPIFEGLWNTILTVFGHISDTIGGIIDTFRGLIDFIVGIFTGDWDKAWDGIKTFFIGIWETIKGVLETIWSAIVGIIETAINAISIRIEIVMNIIRSVWEDIWNGISDFAKNIWEGIQNIFSNVGNWFSEKFQNAYDGITSIFSKIGSFLSGIWNTIKNTFSALGTSIGDAISNSVKKGINGIISLIEKTINKAINLINGAIGVINLIPGVNVSKIRQLSIPRLAEGGYVKANTPQLAMIGDNRHQGEIIAPEDKLEAIYRKVNKEDGAGNNQKVIELLEMIIQILRNLDFNFNLNLDSYELNSQLEKVKSKNRFATNGG